MRQRDTLRFLFPALFLVMLVSEDADTMESVRRIYAAQAGP